MQSASSGTNVGLHPLLRLLDWHGLGSDPAASLTLSEPSGVISVVAAEADPRHDGQPRGC